MTEESMAATTTPEENKRIARRAFEEVVGGGDFDALKELYADDLIKHGGLAGSTEGRNAFAEYIRSLHEAFPAFTVTEELCTCEDDLVTTVNTPRGTHDGPLMGIEPTGKEFEVMAIVVNRIEEGKIAEAWVQADTFGLLQQLGVSELPSE
jgi:predicted ester cyclase